MRVALSGYYGFGNHGDEAVLSGLIHGLQEHGHEPVVLSAAPGATERLHGVEARSRTAGLLPALRSVDAVVSGGGGLLQDATSARSLAYYLAVLRLARLLGRRAVVFGQSVGPLSSRGRRWVRSTLRGTPASVRDRTSAELLGSLGIDAHRGADPALIAPVAQTPRAHAAGGAPVVLVPRHGFPAHTALLVEVAERLAADGVQVRVVALHPEQDGEDAALVQRAAGGGAPLVPADFREAFTHVAAARAVLSARLHALVFAAAAGVPHAGLVYDPKVAGFLEQSGGATFHPPFRAESVLRTVCDPADDGAGVRARLLAEAQASFEWLDASLRGVGDARLPRAP